MCGKQTAADQFLHSHMRKGKHHHTQGTSSDQMMAVIISAISVLIGIRLVVNFMDSEKHMQDPLDQPDSSLRHETTWMALPKTQCV